MKYPLIDDLDDLGFLEFLELLYVLVLSCLLEAMRVCGGHVQRDAAARGLSVFFTSASLSIKCKVSESIKC